MKLPRKKKLLMRDSYVKKDFQKNSEKSAITCHKTYEAPYKFAKQIKHPFYITIKSSFAFSLHIKLKLYYTQNILLKENKKYEKQNAKHESKACINKPMCEKYIKRLVHFLLKHFDQDV